MKFLLLLPLQIVVAVSADIGIGATVPVVSSSSSAETKKLSSIENKAAVSLDQYSFGEYIKDFHKSYDSEEEYVKRQQIFETNRAKVMKHNNNQNKAGGYALELNMFADFRDEELPTGYDKSNHRAWRASSPSDSHPRRPTPPIVLNHPSFSILRDIPDAIDWRKSGQVTTPIKNQGGCGSCWAFAATAALESHIAIRTGSLFSFSMQELVSCAPNPNECGGGGGCTGATAEIAYDFVSNYGILEEWRFGYQSFRGKVPNCTIMPPPPSSLSVDSNNLVLRGGAGTLSMEVLDDEGNKNDVNDHIAGAVASIVGFSKLPSNHYESLMVSVATMGPVVVLVAASGWGLYKGGIYDDSNSTTTRDINHAVVLEGYGTDEETDQDYWLVRNSWGPLWGEDGYIRLKRVDPSTLVDPNSDCKVDDNPGDGVACRKDDDGKDVTPKNVKVCGTSGILFDGVVPIGGHLL